MLLLFIIKVFLICIWFIVLRGTLPRYRMDSLSSRSWKEWALAWVAFLILNTGFLILLF